MAVSVMNIPAAVCGSALYHSQAALFLLNHDHNRKFLHHITCAFRKFEGAI